MNIYKKAEEIIREAGAELLKHYGVAAVTDKKKDNASEVVTALDTWAETFIKEELHKADPEIGFVGEEFGGDRTANKFWLLDPIDGTGLFVRGLPFCTTMLALIENEQVQFSIIYNFVTDEMFVAKRGEGATLNGKKIQVSNRKLENAYLGYESRFLSDQSTGIMKTLIKSTCIYKTVNAGYELALVACGKLDGRIMIEPFGVDYDFAPGALLVEEAGGIVTNIGKETYDYKDQNFLATNEEVYEALVKGENPLFPLNPS